MGVVRETLGQPLQVLPAFCQHYRAMALHCQLQRVLCDQLGALLVSDERGVNLLGARVGREHLGVKGGVTAHDAQHERL
jgi:hypothetical protein